MDEEIPKVQRPYPRPLTLSDQTAVSLRLMTPADSQRVLTFARALP